MKKNRLLITISLILTATLLCGGSSPLSSNEPRLTPDNNIIYEKILLPSVTKMLKKDFSSAIAKFEGHDIVCTVKLKEAPDDETLIVYSPEEQTSSIRVDLNEKTDYSKVKPNSDVKIYGKIYLGKESKPEIRIEADHTYINASSTIYDYEFFEGKKYNINDTETVSLAGGEVKYHVPLGWKSVEKNDPIGVDAGSGKCYFLNALKDSSTVECFCIFYFDIPKYVAFDSDFSKTKQIEVSIIENILPDIFSGMNGLKTVPIVSFPQKSVDASYGRSYDYFTSPYRNHDVEFVFTPTENGLCVMTYIYFNDYSSRQDILYLMRTLETK